MVEIKKFKIGLFVATGFILLLLTLFVLSGASMFDKKIRVITIVNESVQGLEKGSQVKYKGVPVGSVTDIIILMNTNQIQIAMDLDSSIFISQHKYFGTKKESETALSNYIKSEISKGLAVRLEYAGITGFKYIEMDYYTPPTDLTKLVEKPEEFDEVYEDAIYIQAMPSMLSDISKNITLSLEKIAKIDFTKIAESLEHSINSVNELVSSKEITTTITSIQELSIKLKEVSNALTVITPDKVEVTYQNVNDALVDFKELAEVVNEKVKNAQIGSTTNSIKDASVSINRSVDTLDSTLLKLNSTIDELSALLKLLNEQPNALLRGKRD